MPLVTSDTASSADTAREESCELSVETGAAAGALPPFPQFGY
jgi:hypothetical protein